MVICDLKLFITMNLESRREAQKQEFLASMGARAGAGDGGKEEGEGDDGSEVVAKVGGGGASV